jgi:hypothetical protein
MRPSSVAVRLLQIAATATVFGAANWVGMHFLVDRGVSILYPATAVGIVASMAFGTWAVPGIILGVMATPWAATENFTSLLTSGLISSIEGLIPHFVFRWRRELTADLRDMRRWSSSSSSARS